ncbi:MAG: type II toxin-antitoxin system VapC family toxin [Acidimicrobiales bacterium]|jgi:predicted nucleic acid-binding protein
MTLLVDTSVMIDYLRGHNGAEEVLENGRMDSPLHASEITRLEVLAGMRAQEELGTRSFLSIFIWHPVDTLIAERAGELGRKWLTSHQSIDGADLAIAATSLVTGCELLTCNVKHFPMFAGLQKPY